MDPVSTAANLVRLIVEIKKQADTASANKHQCEYLATRVDFFTDILNRIHANSSAFGNLIPRLKMLDEAIKECDQYVQKYGHRGYYYIIEWFLYAQTIKAEFDSLNRQLDSCCSAFQLAIGVENRMLLVEKDHRDLHDLGVDLATAAEIYTEEQGQQEKLSAAITEYGNFFNNVISLFQPYAAIKALGSDDEGGPNSTQNVVEPASTLPDTKPAAPVPPPVAPAAEASLPVRSGHLKVDFKTLLSRVQVDPDLLNWDDRTSQVIGRGAFGKVFKVDNKRFTFRLFTCPYRPFTTERKWP
jgi:hypothetical protein